VTHHDTDLFAPSDLAAALGLLTRLPVRVQTARAMARGARAAWAFPLVGVLVGALQALALGALGALGVPVVVTAGLVLALAVVITGAMHEDGLADTADGLWGGWDKARRLAIMKDSHIGTYGVLALGVVFGLRWMALAAVLTGWGLGAAALALIVTGALSRAGMVAVMAALPNARGTGLAQSVGRPSRATAAMAIAIAALSALATGHVMLVGVAALAALGCALIARAKIGGQTGDILGATQQFSEMALLIVLASAAA
jgi:adenosylcobinamide-GDP ribazoletransferase